MAVLKNFLGLVVYITSKVYAYYVKMKAVTNISIYVKQNYLSDLYTP